VLQRLGLEFIGVIEHKVLVSSAKERKGFTLVKSHMVARSRAPTQSLYVGSRHR
jgi:hypothetical protein